MVSRCARHSRRFSATKASERALRQLRLTSTISQAATNTFCTNLLRRFVQRLRQVRDDVVNMFDSHAQPDHFRRHSRFQLFFRRQLPMRRGRGWHDSDFASPMLTMRLNNRNASKHFTPGSNPPFTPNVSSEQARSPR